MRLPTLSLLFATAAAPAQDAPTLVSEGAFLQLEMDGPARWRTRFAGTKLGDMLTSKRFQEMWAPVTKAIDLQLEKPSKHPAVDQRATYEAVLAYAGRVRVGFYAHVVEGEKPALWGFATAGPDGKSDLAAACQFVRDTTDEGERFEPLHIAGLEWLAGDAGDDAFVTMPRMVGEHATMLFGTRSKTADLANLFVAGPGREAPPSPAPLDVRIDGKALLQLMAAAEPKAAVFLRAAGLDALGDVTFRLDAVQRFVDFTVEVNTSVRTGIFLAICPVVAKVPAVLDLVPRQHAAFWVTPFDPGQLMPGVKSVLADWDRVEKMVQENTGIRLGPDLLAHLGGEALWLTAPRIAIDPDADRMAAVMSIVDGYCLGLELRDAAAFARSIEIVLDRGGVLRMRKTDKYRDVDVHRLTVPVITNKLYWAITDGLAVVAFGEQGLKNLHGLLDGVAARARGDRPGAFPAAFTARMGALPPGYCSVSFQSAANMLETYATVISTVGVDEPNPRADPEKAAAVLLDVSQLLRASDLAEMLTVTYHEKTRIVQRTIW